jgi:hypothetical protein
MVQYQDARGFTMCGHPDQQPNQGKIGRVIEECDPTPAAELGIRPETATD